MGAGFFCAGGGFTGCCLTPTMESISNAQGSGGKGRREEGGQEG